MGTLKPSHIQRKQLLKIEALTSDQLNNILFDDYSAIRPQISDQYSSQTMKCHHSALNRYFKKEKGMILQRIHNLLRPMKCSKQFLLKQNVKAVTKHTPTISTIDLEQILEYFCHNHMNHPDPRRLQQQVIFYIIYFFCRRDWKNLYQMKKNTFKLVIEPDGTEYLIQDIDKLDKNHGPDDTEKTNDGRMYTNNCKFYYIIKPITTEFKT